MIFKVALYPSEEGDSVNVPGLPGCWSQGATNEEALANIAVAIREYLDAEIDEPIANIREAAEGWLEVAAERTLPDPGATVVEVEL